MAFRFDKLTLKSQEALQRVQEVARERGHQRLEPIHLLVALLDPEQRVVRSLLSQLGVNPSQIQRAAVQGLDALPKVSGGETALGHDLQRVLDEAQAEADRMKDQYVSVEHLLLGLTRVQSRAGLQDPNRPIGSFLFLGPTGVGKTKLAKALAEFLFDSETAMVRLDMSEFGERHNVARVTTGEKT